MSPRDDDDAYDEFGVALNEDTGEAPNSLGSSDSSELDDTEQDDQSDRPERPSQDLAIPSPFDITQNVIYDPPHVSPRIRAQDGVLLACHRPLQPLEESTYIEIAIDHAAHDDIRQRLDQYGVFDKQLFPDLDGIAKWLKYRAFEISGTI